LKVINKYPSLIWFLQTSVEVREIVDEMIDIKDDYEAVHGAVTEAAPKVFLKYFYVNTKTGEKSGEMLATVKLG
jgi:hypothetical protein